MAASRSDIGDFINISEDEDNEVPFHNIAANAALDDFVIIDDDDENDRTPPPSHNRLGARPTQPAQRRNAEPQRHEKLLDTCKLVSEHVQSLGPTACTVKIGDTVEVRTRHSIGPIQDGDFLRVVKIVENAFYGNISLRGLLFRRNKFLQPMLPRKLNEVYMVLTIDTEDPRPYHVQGLEEISLEKAYQKRKLKVTDQPYPMLSFREHTYYHSGMPDAKEVGKDIADHDVLVCRNIFAHVYGSGERNRNRRRPYQGLLQYVSREEADDGGGILTGKCTERINLVDDDDDDVVLVEHLMQHGPNRLRRYTFGDAFQGGGGASCAAKLAGLKIVWGFDHDPSAVSTASENFRGARIVRSEAADFPPPGFNAACDILHLSPPCQAFSPANTNPNTLRDETNTNALFTVGKIIKAANPRIVTLEETFGLLTRDKHTQWFGILLRMIHDEGYSIRWAVQNTLEYGISQPRKRLALIAAAPGIPLPDMPKPTHGEPGSGLPGFVTVREAIGHIPRGTPNHNPMSARWIDRAPWDPDRPYNRTIMTSNSEVYHWNGLRKFTHRELAGLQGFPRNHTFHGSQTDIERQIGNAVPSTWFKLVLDECVKVLRKVDRVQGRGTHDDNENGSEEIDLFTAPSRTMSPAPPTFSHASMGSSAENAIIIDDYE